MIQKIIYFGIKRIKKTAWAISFIWIFILVSSLIWNLYSLNTHTKEIAISEARANFNKDQAIRFWATKHGGVYVPMNERTPANPSLSHIPDRNIVKPNGDSLTLMNPAYMIRQMFDEFPIEYGVVGRIVSLKPLNPNNAPDEWERKALLSFKKGEKEYFEFTEINGEEYLRLIQPMITEKGCLKCHAFQGYKVGDIRGGVGVSIEMSPLLQAASEQRNTLLFFHLLILFVGLVGIWAGTKYYIKKAIDKLKAEELLNKSEGKVNALSLEITKRKQTEEALRESEDRFKKLFMEAPIGIALIDSYTAQIIETNPMFAKIAGRTEEEMKHIDWKEITHPDDVQEDLDNMALLNEGKIKGFQMEKRYLHKDGNVVWINMTIAPIKVDDNDSPRHLAMIKDITKRKQAEEELLKAKEKVEVSEKRHSAMIENIGDVIAILGADGSNKYQSPNVTRWFGWKPEELKGNGWDKMHPEDVERIQKIFTKVLETDNPMKVEYRFKCKDGVYKWIEVTASNRLNDPAIDGILLNYHDITERKQTEEEIRKAKEQAEKSNKELEVLNATKDKFFSIIAHDLKSPFNSIVGFSNLLVEQVRGENYDGIEKYAGIIEQSSNRAMDLLLNLMEWSRSQTGRMVFNPEHIEMVNLINETELLFDDIAAQKTISIVRDLPANAPVFADKAMISTVLRNLISNAIKFTHPGGKISISVEEKQKELLVSVSDNGVGISKVDSEKLFKIDQTYSTSGTKNEKGTGLGLMLCKEFIKKQHGRIWLESEEGKGSTFYFTLPYRTKKQTERSTANVLSTEDNEEVQINNLSILIAEDDETSDMLITSILSKNNHKILHTINGTETIEACRNNPDIDLILMDIKMPEMNGYEATRQIREFNKDVVIIAQTAFGLSGDRQKAKDAGCNDYISKPIIKDELKRLMQKYFKK